jgi:hypothetical protein
LLHLVNCPSMLAHQCFFTQPQPYSKAVLLPATSTAHYTCVNLLPPLHRCAREVTPSLCTPTSLWRRRSGWQMR